MSILFASVMLASCASLAPSVSADPIFLDPNACLARLRPPPGCFDGFWLYLKWLLSRGGVVTAS